MLIVRNVKKKLDNFYISVSIIKNENIDFYKNLPFDLLNKICIYKDNNLIKIITSNDFLSKIITKNLNQYWRFNYMIELNDLSNYISFKTINYEILMEDFSIYDLEGNIRLEIYFNIVNNIKIVNSTITYNQSL
jgi:hypothetical protein